MALGNESQKEFLFGVLEELSQDLGCWSIICVISHYRDIKLRDYHVFTYHLFDFAPCLHVCGGGVGKVLY